MKYLFCLFLFYTLTGNTQILTPYPENPVIDTLLTTNPSEFWTRWKTDPFIVDWGNDSLRMYYGTNNYGVITQIGTAVSENGNDWVENLTGPVVPIGSAGAWDSEAVETPGVIYVPTNHDTMKYMLYYSGGARDSVLLDTVLSGLFPEVIFQMGMAYSADGVHFTKYNDPSNDSNSIYNESDPVLKIPYSSGGWPDTINTFYGSVAEPSPMYDSQDGKFKMWYIGLGCGTPNCSQVNDNRFRVHYAESLNGIDWSDPMVVLDIGVTGDFDSRLVYAPNVIRVGDEYWMFYGGNDYASGTFFLFSQQIGLAKSSDGINFTKIMQNPVISKGALSTWNNMGVNYPASIIYNDTLRVYYSGLEDSIVNFIPQIGYSFMDLGALKLSEPNFNSGIKMYPNPAKNRLMIANHLLKAEKVVITDIRGKLIFQSDINIAEEVDLDISNLRKGIYLVHFFNNRKKIHTEKLILN